MTSNDPQQPNYPQSPGGQPAPGQQPPPGGFPPGPPQGYPQQGYPQPGGPQQGYPPPGQPYPGYAPQQGYPPGGPPPGWGGGYGQPPGPAKRNPWPWVVLGVLAAAGLVVGLIFGLKGDDDDDSTANGGGTPGLGQTGGGGGNCGDIVQQLNAKLHIEAKVRDGSANIPDGAPTPGSPSAVCDVELNSFQGRSLSGAHVVVAEFRGADPEEFDSKLTAAGWRNIDSGGSSGGQRIYLESHGSKVIDVFTDGDALYVAYVSGMGEPGGAGPTFGGQASYPVPTVSIPTPTFSIPSSIPTFGGD